LTVCLGIPGEVLEVGNDPLRTARVAFGGITKEASLIYTPEAGPGDFVVVHVGFAISRIDRDEAARVFAYLEELGELDELAPPGAGEG
jgi:hydrogenase expression/formation protein HypC